MLLFVYPVSIRLSISRSIPHLSALPQLLLSSFMSLLFPSLYLHVPFLPLYLHVSFPGSILHYASLHIWKSPWPIYFTSCRSVNRLMGTRCAPLPSLHRWVSVHISNPSCYSYLLPIPPNFQDTIWKYSNFFTHLFSPSLASSSSLCSTAGSSLFQCSVDENISKNEDMIILHRWNSSDSIPLISKVNHLLSH